MINFFYKLSLANGLRLSKDSSNKWILTKNNEIVEMTNSVSRHQELFIYGSPLSKLENIFETPIQSSYLNIFKSNLSDQLGEKLNKISDIKYKMVITLGNKNQHTFIPLIHTLDMCSGNNLQINIQL